MVSEREGKLRETSVPETKRRKGFKKEGIIRYVICCSKFEQVVVISELTIRFGKHLVFRAQERMVREEVRLQM